MKARVVALLRGAAYLATAAACVGYWFMPGTAVSRIPMGFVMLGVFLVGTFPYFHAQRGRRYLALGLCLFANAYLWSGLTDAYFRGGGFYTVSLGLLGTSFSMGRGLYWCWADTAAWWSTLLAFLAQAFLVYYEIAGARREALRLDRAKEKRLAAGPFPDLEPPAPPGWDQIKR